MNSDSILAQYSFLLNIPESILEELDLNVLMIPSAEQKEKIRVLEEKTKSFIALYKKNFEPKGKHLCKTIRSANLDSKAWKLIFQFERETQKENDPIVVAYHKPILFFDTNPL